MHHECFCATMADHLGNPAVARALDRLRDEVTIALCLMTTMGAAQDGIGRLRDWQRARSIRKKPFQQAMDALGSGPLPLELLVEDVYGSPVDDADEMQLRRQRIRAVMRRQCRLGRVVKVGIGTYALPDRTDGLKERGPSDCRAILANRRVLPPGGLTASEIAFRLDVGVPTVRKWLAQLRAEGVPLARSRRPFAGRGSGAYSYRIEKGAA